MKNNILFYLLIIVGTFCISSCTKFNTDNNVLSQIVVPPVKAISDSVPICNSIAGTMLAGKTYIINCDVTIPAGDSLVIQPGVHLIFNNQAGMIVEGNLFSLGTQQNPIYFTVNGQTHTDQPVIDFNYQHDSAFDGLWKGVAGDVSCQWLVFKWTHLEYCGAAAGSTGGGAYSQSNYYNVTALATTAPSYAVYLNNANGYLVFEDSWIYGTPDDAMRLGVNGGQIAVLRSTFEKCGSNTGDVCNFKAGSVGDVAYNLYIGGATNSIKLSDVSQPTGVPQCNVRVYNNTIINSGYRGAGAGKGGSINFEKKARGMAFNNLLVNCRLGMRFNATVPDTAYLYAGNYGYNYYWADSLSVANEFIPYSSGSVIKPVATDIPNPFTYLPANYDYLPDAAYNGSSVVQLAGTNPLFTNYPLPVTGGYYLADINAVGNFNFHLQLSSPCIGKGFTGFTPLQLVPTDPMHGVTMFSYPGSDMGCYQADGSGNQH